MRFKDFILVLCTKVVCRRRRILLAGFLVKIWLLLALPRTILPVPVFLKRLAAALFVFILGIPNPFFLTFANKSQLHAQYKKAWSNLTKPSTLY